MLDIKKIKLIVIERLKPLNPSKIILFGSYAYGTPNEQSDIDLCIVENKVISKIKEKRKIRNLLKDIKVAKDILVVDNEYYINHSDENLINTTLYDVRTKGEVLYEKEWF